MLWPICLFVIMVLLLIVKWNNRNIEKVAEQIPYASFGKVPILGHALNFRGDCEDLMRKLEHFGRDSLANGGVACLWLLKKLIIAVTDPDTVEVVMKVCLEKDDLNNIARRLIGFGSIFAPVSIWRRRRKILAPTFASKTVNSFVQIFAKQSQVLLDALQDDVGKGDVSIFNKVSRYSMDSICETTLGTEVNSQSLHDHPLPQSFALHCKLGVQRAMRPWYHNDAVYKWSGDYAQFNSSADLLQNFVKKIIKSKREQLSRQEHILTTDKIKTKAQSLVDLLMSLEDGKGFTDLELQEESLVLVLAGTDTSSVGVSFTALLIAKHPQVQEKVYQEVMEVLGDRPVRKEDLPKLKYLEAVLKESLRLYPPVPVLIKRPSSVLTLPNSVTIVPGRLATLVNIWAVHRNTKYWGADAELFILERFFENPPTHPYAYIPFGRGPRMCLGAEYAMMSMKTVLATLVRRFRFLPPISGFGPEEDLPTSFEVMMKHVGNFQLQLQLREP